MRGRVGGSRWASVLQATPTSLQVHGLTRGLQDIMPRRTGMMLMALLWAGGRCLKRAWPSRSSPTILCGRNPANYARVKLPGKLASLETHRMVWFSGQSPNAWLVPFGICAGTWKLKGSLLPGAHSEAKDTDKHIDNSGKLCYLCRAPGLWRQTGVKSCIGSLLSVWPPAGCTLWF